MRAMLFVRVDDSQQIEKVAKQGYAGDNPVRSKYAAIKPNRE